MLDGIRIAMFLHKVLLKINWMIWRVGFFIYATAELVSGIFVTCTHMWRKAGLTTFYFWFNYGFHGHIFFPSSKVQAFLQPMKHYIKYFLEWPSHINSMPIRNFINKHGGLANKIICILFWIQIRSFVSCLVKPSYVSWTLGSLDSGCWRCNLGAPCCWC